MIPRSRARHRAFAPSSPTQRPTGRPRPRLWGLAFAAAFAGVPGWLYQDAAAQTAVEATMVLEGDVAAVYTNGRFVIWNPQRGSARAAGAMSMAAARPAGAAQAEPDPVAAMEASLDVVAKAPIAADGTFRIAVDVDAPREVFFYVLGAVSPEGHRMAPVKGQNFILEPGNLTLTMDERARFTLAGGKYNDAVFNAWRRSDEYVQAEARKRALQTPADGETEAARRERVDAMQAAQNRIYDLETEGRAHIAKNHPDPLVRRLTIETAWLHGPWVLESLRGLAELTPDDPWVVERLARSEAAAEKRAKSQRIATGTDILDFTAETLDGESVRLADVRAECKVVLLEFWASWCGPCRVEIPHMKQAYQRHRGAGFEIVSFTIDNDREDWEIASEEEDLPWINLGMGEDAEAAKAYSVTGVPLNFLVDAATGEILAKDLRGHHLDESARRTAAPGKV